MINVYEMKSLNLPTHHLVCDPTGYTTIRSKVMLFVKIVIHR